MNIVLQLSELRLSTALSPLPPGRKGYCLMWSILGCAAGQDMVLVSVPKHGKLFYEHLSLFVFLSKTGPGFQTRSVTPTPKNWSKYPFSSPPREPEGTGVARLCRTYISYAKCYELSVAKIMEHSIPEQNAITLPARANNNLNSLSTALSALSPCN